MLRQYLPCFDKAVWINSQRKINISSLFHKYFKHGYLVCSNWFVLMYLMCFRSHHVYKGSWRRCWWEILDSVPQHLSCSSIPSCARLDHPPCWYPSWGPSGTPLAECSSPLSLCWEAAEYSSPLSQPPSLQSTDNIRVSGQPSPVLSILTYSIFPTWPIISSRSR